MLQAIIKFDHSHLILSILVVGVPREKDYDCNFNQYTLFIKVKGVWSEVP